MARAAALRSLVLAALAVLLLLRSTAAPADMPAFLILAWSKLDFWWTLPLAIAIEILAIRWIFNFTWLRSAVAAIVVNAVTFACGFFLYPYLGGQLYPVLAPLVIGLVGAGQFIDLGATLAAFAIVDTLIELPVLKFVFRAVLSLKRALLFLLANALTGAIFFAVLVVPNLPERIPAEEVAVLEQHYASEIRYMRTLFDEMPQNVTQTDAEYVYYAFDQEWEGKKKAEVSEYRFYELMIGWTKGDDAVTPKVNRFERSVRYDAQYSKRDTAIRRGVYDDSLNIYRYRITRTIRGDEYYVSAVFEAPE